MIYYRIYFFVERWGGGKEKEREEGENGGKNIRCRNVRLERIEVFGVL